MLATLFRCLHTLLICLGSQVRFECAQSLKHRNKLTRCFDSLWPVPIAAKCSEEQWVHRLELFVALNAAESPADAAPIRKLQSEVAEEAMEILSHETAIEALELKSITKKQTWASLLESMEEEECAKLYNDLHREPRRFLELSIVLLSFRTCSNRVDPPSFCFV